MVESSGEVVRDSCGGGDSRRAGAAARRRRREAAHACGKVGGVTVRAHRISCRTARRIYRADSKGHLPRGWVCSASIGRCYRLKAGPARYVSWRPQS
jgi:hypothetical protein